MTIKEQYNLTKKYVKDILRLTPAEIIIGAALGVTLTAGLSWKHEADRGKTIPLAFSEITQIEKDAVAGNERVGPVTEYLGKVNDTTMKIFECWNKANARVGSGTLEEKFAQELANKLSKSTDNYHYSLRDLLEQIPEKASSTLNELKPFMEVMQRMNVVNSELERAWDDRHRDEYHTEVYWTTETDSKGNAHSEMHTRQVYDYTDHDYYFDKITGKSASDGLKSTIALHPELKLNEKLRTASRTNPAGEKAAKESRINEHSDEPFGKVELLEISGLWCHGSTLNLNLSTIYNSWNGLKNQSGQLEKSVNSAQAHYHFRTYSHSDSGPNEFQVNENILRNGQSLSSSVSKVYSGIQYAKDLSPRIMKRIEELQQITLDHTPGDSKKAMENIMEEARAMYDKNFEKGINSRPFRGYMPFLMGFLGMIAGAGLGFVADEVGKRFKWYETK